MAVSQIEEAGQYLGFGLRIEPEKVLVVALDEDGVARCGALVREPSGKVAGAVVRPCGSVDAIWIRLYAEVAHVKHPIEARSKRRLEREDIVIHLVDGAMDVTGSAEQHRHFFMFVAAEPEVYPAAMSSSNKDQPFACSPYTSVYR